MDNLKDAEQKYNKQVDLYEQKLSAMTEHYEINMKAHESTIKKLEFGFQNKNVYGQEKIKELLEIIKTLESGGQAIYIAHRNDMVD